MERKERELKKVEPRMVEPKLDQRGGRLKGEPNKAGSKGKSKERGTLQLWQIQQTLGRGDFIEVTPSQTSRLYQFAVAGSAEGERFPGLALLFHPGTSISG